MTQTVKFYQVGSRAVGNRLLAPSHRTEQSNALRVNAIDSGHRACQGCGEALAARYVLDTAMRVTDGQLVVVNATGCLEVFTTPSPESSWRVPWLHSVFANASSVASGVAAALQAQGRTDIRVLAQGGDGGTVDIGFACLSGLFERNDYVLYVCYDNEAYMNTGVQRSGSTPPYARTATSDVLGRTPGNRTTSGKDLARIALAHDIPFVGTATVAELHDLEAKVEKAMSMRCARYLHVLVPCPLGWGVPSSQTIELARMAQQSGLFPILEAEHGTVTKVLPIRRRVAVHDYLAPQARYAHLFGDHPRTDIIETIQHIADRNIERYGIVVEEEAP